MSVEDAAARLRRELGSVPVPNAEIWEDLKTVLNHLDQPVRDQDNPAVGSVREKVRAGKRLSAVQANVLLQDGDLWFCQYIAMEMRVRDADARVMRAEHATDRVRASSKREIEHRKRLAEDFEKYRVEVAEVYEESLRREARLEKCCTLLEGKISDLLQTYDAETCPRVQCRGAMRKVKNELEQTRSEHLTHLYENIRQGLAQVDRDELIGGKESIARLRARRKDARKLAEQHKPTFAERINAEANLAGPKPTNTATSLIHTVALFPSAQDSDYAILGTSNVYGDGVRTGITWGDLRAMAAAASNMLEES